MAKVVPFWSNPDLLLFHGIIQASANAILAIGPAGRTSIRVALSKPRCDFGRGFYMTTSESQARTWAHKQAAFFNTRNPALPHETAAIVESTLERNDLSKLATLSFVRGDAAATDYWNLIRHFRLGPSSTKDHGRMGNSPWYDVAVGPVAASWRVAPRVYSDMDQFSFHSPAAELFLNSLPAVQKRQLP